MPLIVLRVNKMPSEELKEAFVEGMTGITQNILRKNKSVIVVRIDADSVAEQWNVAGKAINTGAAIFELNILITKGTNTDEEKSSWIAEAWKLVTDMLGKSSNPNYISINEIEGSDWGYNGLTQRQRMQQLN